MSADMQVADTPTTEDTLTTGQPVATAPVDPSPLLNASTASNPDLRTEGLIASNTGADLFAAPGADTQSELSPVPDSSPKMVPASASMTTTPDSSTTPAATVTDTAEPVASSTTAQESPSLWGRTTAFFGNVSSAIGDVIAPAENDPRSLFERIEDGAHSLVDTSTDFFCDLCGIGEETRKAIKDWAHGVVDSTCDIIDDYITAERYASPAPGIDLDAADSIYALSNEERDDSSYRPYEQEQTGSDAIPEYSERALAARLRRRDLTFLGESHSEDVSMHSAQVDEQQENDEIHLDHAEERRRAIVAAAEARLPDNHEVAVELEQFVEDASLDYHQFGESADSLAAKVPTEDPEETLI